MGILDQSQSDTDEPLRKSFKVGQIVIANVFKIESTGIQLTMRFADRKTNADFELGQVVEGRVVGMNQLGSFVDIGALQNAFLESRVPNIGLKVIAEICRLDADGIELSNAKLAHSFKPV